VPRLLPSGQDGPYNLAVDGSGVYWTNGTGTVEKASLTSLSRTIISSGQRYPKEIAINDTSIYWINGGSGPTANGAIVRLSKP
jgi:hypothetical protein